MSTTATDTLAIVLNNYFEPILAVAQQLTVI
jgi:hypothetical protein